ncbi:hypothetical protein F2Q70_00044505 [Brassica cretica]|uniref:Uncharacterized protein n=1 Tax=Brassica cretica TaxID=69181 RepID=A0A3N6T6P9_BRACR|nr:hypothetical protein F2Q70_00044505 [Brassica cretica]KAF3519560.1 hypothetical protein DY000_02062336 [Brassica cretica]
MRNQNIRSEVAERVVHMGHRRPPDYNHPRSPHKSDRAVNHPACEQLLETRLQDHGAEEKDPTDTEEAQNPISVSRLKHPVEPARDTGVQEGESTREETKDLKTVSSKTLKTD